MKKSNVTANFPGSRWGLTLVLFSLFLAASSAHAQKVTLTKEFLSSPLPGETVVVSYTITSHTPNFITGFGFTDDFGAVLPGLQVIGTPAGTACGSLSGSSVMTLSGGFVPPMAVCTFTATVSVPVSAPDGTYLSTTSMVSGNEIGVGVFMDPGASADLVVVPIVAFEKSFIDDPTQPGGLVTLQFLLTNNSSISQVTNLNFTDDLDATLTGLVATGLPVTGICGSGEINGTDLLTFTNGRLGPSESCSIQIPLAVPLAAATGSHTNTTSGVSGLLGGVPFTSGTATDDLKIGLPVLTKEFTDDPTFPGDTVTLEFTISNPSSTDTFTDLNFTDDLSEVLPGLEVAGLPAPAFCGAGSTLTGTTLLTMSGGSLAPLTSCTFSVVLNVPNDAAAGRHLNSTGSLFATSGMTLYEGEPASDQLRVIGVPTLTKAFINDPVAPGEQVTLQFTITNFNRFDTATNIAFTDDLDAALSELVAVGLPLIDPCGAGSTLTGTDLLTLSGGNLAPGGDCTFNVTLEVPASASAGTHVNTTTAITSTIGGTPVTAGTASDALVVEPATLITLDWSDDPVVGGGTATIDITLTNSSPIAAASGVTFFLDFNNSLPTQSSAPTTTCDGDVSFTPFNNPPPPGDAVPARLSYGTTTPGTLAPGAGCTIQLVLNVDTELASGSYLHTSSGVTSTVDMVTYVGPPGSDELIVVAGPRLTKEFTDDPVAPGGTVNLELTLTHQDQADTDATGITFTDDLSTVLADLVATGLPLVDPCGAGSSLAASAMDTLLTFSGGTLAPGESCTFNVTLNVPADAAPGDHTNTTSGVTATVSGLTTISNPASDDLQVAGLTFTKEFLDDPVIAGDTVMLRFTLENSSPNPTEDATDISFTDSLSAALPGLTVDPGSLPPAVNTCGGTLSGTNFLIYSNGSLTVGSTCTIEVEVDVPLSAEDDDYVNITSSLTATVNGNTVTINPAIDTLTVTSSLLALSKSFTDDPVAPGGTVTLELTLTNLDDDHAAADIAFTDDLGAALSGLTFDSILLNDCVGSTVLGTTTTLVTVSDVSLAAAESCSLRLSLSVPGGAAPGLYVNTTSDLTGMINGLPVEGPPANDTLEIVQLLQFTKSFDGPSTATGEAILTFTITNPGSNSASDLAFSDDLDDVIPGLVATGLPTLPCGPGSSIGGTSFLSFTGGSLPPLGGTCSFDVTVQLPITASAGSFPNTTSDLFQAGIAVSDPATANLIVEPPPAFAKAFAPNSIGLGLSSTLTFTIDNTPSALSAQSLFFIDNLPAGLVVAMPPMTNNTCAGTVTAVPGAGSISLSGGTVAAGVTCTVQVNTTANALGMLVNTSGELSSTSGLSGSAGDTLVVNPQPGFAKVFAPNPIAVGGLSTLTFTLDNSASTVAATNLDFTDTMPAAVVVATPSGAVTTCTGGTLTAISGSGVVSYTNGTVAAGSSCTVSVDVTSATVGDHVNTSGNLTSSLGASGTASDTLTVNPPPVFSKVFDPDAILVDGTSTLSFTIDNSASTAAASALDFTDNMPVTVVVATPSSAVTTCTGGTLTATSGTSSIIYTNGTVAAGSTCTVSVDVTSATVGEHVNTSGNLTSSLGDSGTASDTLTVNPPPDFSKTFDPDTIPAGSTSTLSFTIDNSASTVDATALDFTDNMPAAVLVATPSGAATTCTGGTLTAASGTSVVSYTGGTAAAGSSCTVTVEVTSGIVGEHVNTSGELTSSSGSSGSAEATLTVEDSGPPVVTAVTTPEGALGLCDNVRLPIQSISVLIEDDLTPILNADDAANYQIVGAGPDKDFTTTTCGAAVGDDVEIGIAGVNVSDLDPLSIEVELALAVGTLGLPADLYRVIVCDSITDSAGNALDGDGDMTAGGDFVIPFFRADPFNLLDNGNFDDCPVTLDPWITLATSPNVITTGTPGTDDADGSPLSASATFMHSDAAPSFLAQCVEVSGGTTYSVSVQALLQPIAGAFVFLTESCEFFDASDCLGAALGSASVVSLLEPPGFVWELFDAQMTSPSGAVSATCEIIAEPVNEDVQFNLLMDAAFFGTTGQIFSDGFESGDLSAWSSTNP